VLGLGPGMVGRARGWVAGGAGFWGALATWVGVGSSSPQVPGHLTSVCDTGVNFRLCFKLMVLIILLNCGLIEFINYVSIYHTSE